MNPNQQVSVSVITALFVLFVMMPNNGVAQGLPPELAENRYVQRLLQVVDLWNKGALKLPPRKELRPELMGLLDQKLKEKPFGYETKEWADRTIEQFDKLPEVAEPKLPFDSRAVSVMSLAYAINLGSLREFFVSETPELQRRIPLPLYIVFTEAQQRAFVQKKDAISVDEVVGSIFRWWTRVWPFCAP